MSAAKRATARKKRHITIVAPEYAATAWEEGFRFLFHAISNYGKDSQAALLLKYMFIVFRTTSNNQIVL